MSDKIRELHQGTQRMNHKISDNKTDQKIKPSWITICGEEAKDFESQVAKQVEDKIALKKFTEDDIDYVAKLKLPLVGGALTVSDKDLEQLRRLCQLWDVELQPVAISSHRRFVGPIIVAIKKLLMPFMRAILKDTLKRQRDFNAATISFFADIMQQRVAK